jgi:hypothetical protein
MVVGLPEKHRRSKTQSQFRELDGQGCLLGSNACCVYRYAPVRAIRLLDRPVCPKIHILVRGTPLLKDVMFMQSCSTLWILQCCYAGYHSGTYMSS